MDRLEAQMISKLHTELNPIRDRVSALEQSAKHMESQNIETREAVRDLDNKMERQHDRLYKVIEDKFDKISDKINENSKMITRVMTIGTTVVVLVGIGISVINWFL